MIKVSIRSIARPKNLFTLQCAQFTTSMDRMEFIPDASTEEMRTVDIVRVATMSILSCKMLRGWVDMTIDDKEYERISLIYKQS